MAAVEARRRVGQSLFSFVRRIRPSFEWSRHHLALANTLDRVVSGEIRRLMVFMPPRHGKSELVSRLFPAYYLYRNPDRHIGLASYSGDLAMSMSQQAMENYLRSGMKVHDDVAAKKEWMTCEGGAMWAVGVGGSITGRGGHVLIVDDPVKNAEEAFSERIRETQKEWWRSTWFTRQEASSALVLIMTRWHEDDLAGFLLSEEAVSPEYWHILNFEAIKDEGTRFPVTCHVEPDWRREGEALWEERFGRERLLKTQTSVGAYFWNALYQQRPTSPGGNLWNRRWFNVCDALPDGLIDTGYDWDLAYTEDDSNAACAFVKSARDVQGNVYILDIGFEWYEFPELISWMRTMREPQFVEAKASGKSAVQVLVREGIYAKEVQVAGADKIARARLISPIAEQGKVFVMRRLMAKLLDDERQGILRFPSGPYADLNDAFVQALNRHHPRTMPRYRFIDIGDNGNGKSLA